MRKGKPDNKSSREELQRILDFSPDIICTVGADGKFVRVSAAVRNILGYSPDEMEGRSLFEFIHEGDHAKTAAIGEKVLTEKEVSHFENRYIHKAGHAVLIIWTCYWDDVKQQLYSVGRDGTERQKAEQQLLASEQRFRTLVENSVDSVAILSPEGWPTYVSPSITNVLGYTEEEALSMNLAALMHPDDMERVSSVILQSLQQPGVPQPPSVARARHKDGSWRWMEATITNMLDDPIINGIVDNFRDVTETVVAETQRKQSEAFLKDAQRLAKMGSWNFDFEHDKLTWSDSLYDVFGVDRETFLETHGSFLSLIHPEDKKLAEETSKRTQETGETFNIEYRITTPSGEKRVIEEFGYGEKDASGKVVRLFGTAQDITERRKAEEQIRLANERFEYVNKATNDAIYDWDVASDVFHWGESFERIFGHKVASEVFRLEHWVRLMHPVDNKRNKESWDSFLADKKQSTWHKEFRFRRGDGTFAYAEEIGHLLRDKKGLPLRMIGVLRDISLVKRTEIQKQIQHQVASYFRGETGVTSALNQTLEYLADFSEYKTAEVWMVSTTQNHLNLISVFAADKRREAFTADSQQIKKLALGEGLPGRVWKNRKAEIWEDIDSNQAFARRNAAKKAGLMSAFALPLFHGDVPVGVLVMCSDEPLLTDKNKTEIYYPLSDFLGSEIKRKQQEEEMYLLFESAPDILAIATPDGHFAKVNPAFCRLMGCTEKELVSQPFENLLHPDDRQPTMQEYAETVTAKRTFSNFINRYITRSGTYRWISWSSSQIFGEDGLFFAYGRDVTEIKELETLLANATKLARVGAWEIDVASGKTYFSGMTKEIHEVEDDFVPSVGSEIDFYREDVRNAMENLVNEGLKNGTPWDVELPLVTAKGNERWVRSIGQAEFYDGQCIRLYGSLQDIHERKMTELTLKEAFEERDTILESIGDAFFAVDTNWVVTYWNKQAEVVIGKTRAEVLGRNLWDSFPDAVGLQFYTQYHIAVESNKTVQFEAHYPGTDQWLEVSAYPSEKGLSVYFKDISIRKTAEEQIRQANERFEKVAQATNDTIWDWDIVNNRLYRGHGLKTKEQEKDLPTISEWSENIHPDDRAGITQSVQDALENKDTSTWQHEYRFRNTDGKYAHVIDRGIFIRDQRGKAVRMVGAMTDISYRKEYEESLTRLNEQLEKHSRDLEHSNKELEQFAYIASHDLQEPLRMVSSFMAQLNKKYGDQLDDKARQYIHFAVDGSMRMKQIILDLLEFSRVGKHEDKLQEVSLNEVLKDVLQMQQNQIEESKASIQFAQLPTLRTYRSPLVQVMHNLLGNALKYRREGIPPDIYIDARVHKNKWLISVKDNGIGIESEYYDKIFIIFQRLHGKDEFSGTGLGLAIVKKIVENLGGSIWLESQPGHGSTFYFTLPYGNEAAPSKASI